MKKNRFFAVALFLGLTSFGFTGCESDSDSNVVADSVVTFEDVNLGTAGFWNGNDLSGDTTSYNSWGKHVINYTGSFKSKALTCNNLYSDWGGTGSWIGMACSSLTNMDSIGSGNQYSVYATSGADNSKKFAIIYSNGATCTFDREDSIKSLMVNNSTYAYWALKEGKDGTGFCRKFVSKDSYKIRIFGLNSAGAKTDSLDVFLADFRDGKSYICKEWTKVSLKSLGKIKKLSFDFSSTDNGSYGMNTPAYACIDNIDYSK